MIAVTRVAVLPATFTTNATNLYLYRYHTFYVSSKFIDNPSDDEDQQFETVVDPPKDRHSASAEITVERVCILLHVLYRTGVQYYKEEVRVAMVCDV